MRILIIAAAALSLSACSSIVEGTTQTLALESDPSGAVCSATRGSQQLGAVTTPGQLLVTKNRWAITLRCEKEGRQTVEQKLESYTAATSFGNALVGGPVGLLVDEATGAGYKYDTNIRVILPLNEMAMAPSAP